MNKLINLFLSISNFERTDIQLLRSVFGHSPFKVHDIWVRQVAFDLRQGVESRPEVQGAEEVFGTHWPEDQETGGGHDDVFTDIAGMLILNEFVFFPTREDTMARISMLPFDSLPIPIFGHLKLRQIMYFIDMVHP